MRQTAAHDIHNADLLKLIPLTSARLLEVGCSSGALAREFKKVNPGCDYLGLDVVPAYLELARVHCDAILACDIEIQDESFYESHRDRDCWIFADALEHFRNPWAVLEKIRKVIPDDGCVVASIPNAQNWAVLAKLAVGDFRYEDSGLLDRTHLRWFTRQTIIELFAGAGFRITEGAPRILQDPSTNPFLPIIGELAKLCSVDPATAMNDAIPVQYVVRAEPA